MLKRFVGTMAFVAEESAKELATIEARTLVVHGDRDDRCYPARIHGDGRQWATESECVLMDDQFVGGRPAP